ncbi:Sensor histidine kinase TmoS [Roseovarius sp. THAF27]|uniref:sensor histidine kinase n=1 Tax=Roseovarius sp. THAF27 TaxID=2587850 RepID=UPI0012AA442E|nr:HAMP domain-containing sensor histidine kinase [Roseovarius sp. THAF27]QFT81700.1 Sensor histidine kinase TmoS [Roseovarius sp. THAF27]
MSLKTLLGLGALALGVGTWVTALILWLGLLAVSDRLDATLKAEQRMSGYAGLSTQAATFLVVATEAVQREMPAATRTQRLEPVVENLRTSFERLQQNVAQAVQEAEDLGIDAQSRFGTQSLGLARMEALLTSTMRGLSSDDIDRPRLQAHIDSFATGFDPLLSQAVQTEQLFRNDIRADIVALRQKLTLAAIVIAVASVLMVLAFYFGLIRPQFARLDRLRDAAQKIGQEDFAIDLPETRRDEIGGLYAETNRMAHALAARKSAVEEDRAQLSSIIAARTEELRAANETLAEIDENRRRFFADVSHELRTPLTVILMEAQIGRAAGGPEADAFATIEARAARLNRRIDDLLRVARSDSGQLALESAPVPLPDLMTEVHEEVRAEADNAGMTLTLSNIPAVTLTCDRNWIRQVLVGLVRNAIRHARDGGRIRLDAQAAADMATIAVTDNGPGIPPEDQPGIFERFSQAGSASSQGFGIGLALARWVIESHDGTITLESPVLRDTALGDAPGTKIAVRLALSSG